MAACNKHSAPLPAIRKYSISWHFAVYFDYFQYRSEISAIYRTLTRSMTVLDGATERMTRLGYQFQKLPPLAFHLTTFWHLDRSLNYELQAMCKYILSNKVKSKKRLDLR